MSVTSSTPSYAMQQIAELQRRIPVVGDKVLVDLVNGLDVSRDLIQYRRRRSLLRQLVDQFSGKDEKLQSLLNSNLITGQAALHQWILELCDSIRISQVALQTTQDSLLETRSAIRRQHETLQIQDGKLQALHQHLEQLTAQIHARFNQIETRISRLELRMAARDEFERIFTVWAAGQTYQKLPWAIQILLLVREIFSSTVLAYELRSGDTLHFRELLINEIIIASRQMPEKFFGLEDLLEQSWRGLTEPDQDLIAGLVEVRSIPQHRLQTMPHRFTIATTLELAMLPTNAQLVKPAKCAIELCRSQIADISIVTDTRRFVSELIQETADDHLAIMTGSRVS